MNNNIIYIATHNSHKFTEIANILHPLCCEKIDDNFSAPEETGHSFIENALIKARYASQLTQAPCIADDSGLVVPSLDGQPGIYSARYAGVDQADEKHREKLLHALATTHNRTAFFYCAVVYLSHWNDPCPLIGLGRWDGLIHTHAQGQHGFGYDPIFFCPQLHKTAAELSFVEKNQLSHRAKALHQLSKQLVLFHHQNHQC